MAAPMAKRLKLSEDDFQRISLYILPIRIQNVRLEKLKTCAHSLGFTLLEKYRFVNVKTTRWFCSFQHDHLITSTSSRPLGRF